LNGFYLVFAIISSNYRNKINKILGFDKLPRLNIFLQILITFILSCFAWIFFRANNINDAFIIIKKIFTFRGPLYIENPAILIYSFLGIFFLLFIEYKKEFYRGKLFFLNNENSIIRDLSYALLVVAILLFGVFDGGQFIYFQF
jgi:alginate O-acetyltransferase complex protein AlgI